MSDGEHQKGDSDAGKRFGFVALVGATNAGKSTLLNQLVGQKVSITSRKVQTTRMPIRGIRTEGRSQIVFVDTPGIFKPRRRLDKAMVSAAWGGAADADIVLLLLDAAKPVDVDTTAMVERLGLLPIPKVLVLNKVDRIRKESLLQLSADLNAHAKFEATFMVSALKGSGVADLAQHLESAVPPGQWHFPADEVTDLPSRILAQEITRERIYDRLHDELPYAIAVETTAFTDMGRKKGVRVEQTILVERDSQRAIVLGQGGRTIKEISTEARTQMSELFGRPIHLFLHVAVQEGWANDPARYSDIGLEFPKD